MKNIYVKHKRVPLLKKLMPVIAFLLPGLLHAEIEKVTLTLIQSCGGATLIPNPLFKGGYTPVTIKYERLVGADTWQLHATQEWNNQTSYQTFSGDDIKEAAFFRVKATDNVTGIIYTSNSVAVDPAKWNIGRGTSFSTATAYWGSDCASGSYISIETNYTTQGRPPYTVQYLTLGSDYKTVGPMAGAAIITGVKPFTTYYIKVTDACGMVSNLRTELNMITSYNIDQDATTCNNGKVTVSVNSDNRYSGVAPLTYALGKKYGGMTTSEPEYKFGSSNVFDKLAPGYYYVKVKDACGNLSGTQTVSLGGGLPVVKGKSIILQDSCKRVVVVSSSSGKGPFTYGIKYSTDPKFTYSTNDSITVSKEGYYFVNLKNSCGDTSDQAYVDVNIPRPAIDWYNTTATTGNCYNDVTVALFYNGALQPVEYGIRPSGSGNFTYQASNIFKGVAPGMYDLTAKDRCGGQGTIFQFNNTTNGCSLRTTTGNYETGKAGIPCNSINGNGWIDVKDNAGNLIYSINPNGNNLNTVCWGVSVVNGSGLRQSTIKGKDAYFLDRNFYIEPKPIPTLTTPVKLRIYFTNDEFLRMQTYLKQQLGNTYELKDLKILKKKASAQSPADLSVINDDVAQSSQFTVITPRVAPYGNDWYMEFEIKDFSEFNPYIGELNILPLQWLSFTAARQKDVVNLNWQTTAEINTSHFEVQWGADALNFNTKGTVQAKNQPGTNSYSFNHMAAGSGKNYYRLKQVDKDGRFAYSNVISAEVNSVEDIILSPNPAHDNLTVQWPANIAAKQIRVFDGAGKQVLQQIISPSSQQAQLNIQKLASGWYILSVEGATQKRVRFIKH